MKKKICLLCVYICIGLCACQKTDFLKKYEEVYVRENAKRTALIYLDEDFVPELLILKDGEYRLYSFDGFEVKAVDMIDSEIKANTYGVRFDLERRDSPEHQIFYWFEYVPYQGLIRVHGGTNEERHDYYLRYTNGSLKTELEAKSIDYSWHTYDAEKEIPNEEFLSRLSDYGYDKLIPCEYLYGDVKTAYENINAISNNSKLLEDFVNGKTGALDYVGEINDVPEKGFVMRNYDEFYNEITAEDEAWGSLEYIDFDNDGEEELIIHGYCGACLFFDVVGDTVYKVLHTGSTTDVAYVAEREGRKVIARTDLTHAGRKSYRIMTYDSCCCLTDWFHLFVGYEGKDYTKDDSYEYRNHEISMEEFEDIVDSIHKP